MESNERLRYTALRWGQLFLCSITSATFVLGGLLLVLYHFLDLKMFDTSTCSKFEGFTYCFYDDQWDSETYLALITSFYSTVIAFLIIIITLVSGIAYFAIKSSHSQQIEEAVEGELPRYFDRVSSGKVVNDAIEPLVKEKTDFFEGMLSRHDERLQQIEEEMGLSPPRVDEEGQRIQP